LGRLRALAPIALIGLGVFMVLLPIVYPIALWKFATIVYPPYFWADLRPDGTADNPTIITPGETITVYVMLVEDDYVAGIDLPESQFWDVTVVITGNTYSTTLYLLYTTYYYVDHLKIATFEAPWTIPTGENVTYKFAWEAKIYDEFGNHLGTATYTTYAKTPVEPDGEFRVNDLVVNEKSKIVVFDPTIKVEFRPTKDEDEITGVYVEFWKADSLVYNLTLTKQPDGTYTGTYTLEEGGVWKLKGFVEWVGGAPLPKMSVAVQWGEAPPPPPTISRIQIVGAVLIAVGSAIFLYQRRRV